MKRLTTQRNAIEAMNPKRNVRIARTDKVLVELLSRAPASQMRTRPSQQLIAQYARAMTEGAEFPPVVVFEDEDGSLYLADGYHRVEATTLAALKDLRHPAEIFAEIWPGTFTAAARYALRANSRYGKRMTGADYKGAIKLAFDLDLVRARHAKDLIPAVVSLTGCSIAIARRCSDVQRRAMLAKRDSLIIQMDHQGRGLQAIGDELLIGRSTVCKILRPFNGKRYVHTLNLTDDWSPPPFVESVDAELENGPPDGLRYDTCRSAAHSKRSPKEQGPRTLRQQPYSIRGRRPPQGG